MSKAMQILAAIGERTTYADLAFTGFDKKLVMSIVADLKIRKLVRRINTDAQKHEVAFFQITDAGRAYLQGVKPPPIRYTSVQLAIAARPQLATVWGAA